MLSQQHWCSRELSSPSSGPVKVPSIFSCSPGEHCQIARSAFRYLFPEVFPGACCNDVFGAAFEEEDHIVEDNILINSRLLILTQPENHDANIIQVLKISYFNSLCDPQYFLRGSQCNIFFRFPRGHRDVIEVHKGTYVRPLLFRKASSEGSFPLKCT